MRTLIHLSDLHFGRVEANVLLPLSAMLWQVRPDLIVISGDFTQNASDDEFLEARKFLATLPEPRFVVPGNHDMPFLNVLHRYIVGLDRYRRHISDDTEPYFEDAEIAVMGINTARVHSLRGGSINSAQMARVRQRMCSQHSSVTRILVTHHPFDLPEPFGRRLLVRRSRQALEQIAGCVDLLLAGHMHISHAGHTAARYKIHAQSAIFAQAGTATSTRNRGEPNAFNLIRIDRPNIDVERMTWNSEHQIFSVTMSDHFHLTPGGWARTPADLATSKETETGELDEMTIVPD
jgi:3',5'-cyclic AMP phosphodiesterase CpdA